MQVVVVLTDRCGMQSYFQGRPVLHRAGVHERCLCRLCKVSIYVCCRQRRDQPGLRSFSAAAPAPPLLLLLLYSCRQHMPDHAAAAGLSVPVLCYEQLLDEAAESGALSSFAWPKLHEDSPAGLCYTSGTTGNPKVGFMGLGVQHVG
jgi:hypothetical protein